jgi:hypothetical protein
LNLQPDEKQIKDADEEFWRWVFRENDGSDHPLKVSGGGKAQLRRGNLLIVAGSLPDDKLRDRSLNIPPGVDFIFVPGENCVYTEADKDGQTDQELIDNATNDMSDSQAKVLLNGQNQQIHKLPGHKLSPLLNIEKCIGGAGKSGKGEGESCIRNNPPGPTRAAAACDYAIIPANTLKSGDKIKIEGTGRAGPNQKRGLINVTYQVE